MNTISHLIIKVLLIGFLSLSFTNSYSLVKEGNTKSKKESPSQIQIQGRIHVKNKIIKGNYKVDVLYFDSVTSSFVVHNNEPIKLLLKKDSPYVLRISKKGFVPRLICINTNTKEIQNMNGAYSFYFETEFIEARDAMRLDNEALELPVALIAYDKKTGNFDQNKDYTSFVKQRISSSLNTMP